MRNPSRSALANAVRPGVEPTDSSAPGASRPAPSQRHGGGEHPVALGSHGAAAGVLARLVVPGGRVGVAAVREQAGQPQPRLADGLGERDERRPVVPAHAAAAVAGVDLDEHLGPGERPGGPADALGRVDGERDPGAALGQRRQPGERALAHDGCRQPHVVKAGRRERLGLVDRRHRQAPGPARRLEPGDLDALVGLRVGPQGHAVRVGARLHRVQVRLQAGAVDEQRRGREVGDEHAVGGWGCPYPPSARPDPPAT